MHFLQLDKTSGCDVFTRQITKAKIHRHKINYNFIHYYSQVYIKSVTIDCKFEFLVLWRNNQSPKLCVLRSAPYAGKIFTTYEVYGKWYVRRLWCNNQSPKLCVLRSAPYAGKIFTIYKVHESLYVYVNCEYIFKLCINLEIPRYSDGLERWSSTWLTNLIKTYHKHIPAIRSINIKTDRNSSTVILYKKIVKNDDDSDPHEIHFIKILKEYTVRISKSPLALLLTVFPVFFFKLHSWLVFQFIYFCTQTLWGGKKTLRPSTLFWIWFGFRLAKLQHVSCRNSSRRIWLGEG
jgi:hypothetical protein